MESGPQALPGRPDTEALPEGVGLGGGKRQLVAKTEVQRQPRRDLVRILAVQIESSVADVALEITSTLQKDHWLARQEAGKRVGVGETSEHKKTVRSDALQAIDLVKAKTSAKFHFVAAMDPAQRSGEVIGILKRIARSRNGVSD